MLQSAAQPNKKRHKSWKYINQWKGADVFKRAVLYARGSFSLSSLGRKINKKSIRKCPAAAGKPCEGGESCAACSCDGYVIRHRGASQPCQVWPYSHRITKLDIWHWSSIEWQIRHCSAVKNISWNSKLNNKSLHHVTLQPIVLPQLSLNTTR